MTVALLSWDPMTHSYKQIFEGVMYQTRQQYFVKGLKKYDISFSQFKAYAFSRNWFGKLKLKKHSKQP